MDFLVLLFLIGCIPADIVMALNWRELDSLFFPVKISHSLKTRHPIKHPRKKTATTSRNTRTTTSKSTSTSTLRTSTSTLRTSTSTLRTSTSTLRTTTANSYENEYYDNGPRGPTHNYDSKENGPRGPSHNYDSKENGPRGPPHTYDFKENGPRGPSHNYDSKENGPRGPPHNYDFKEDDHDKALEMIMAKASFRLEPTETPLGVEYDDQETKGLDDSDFLNIPTEIFDNILNIQDKFSQPEGSREGPLSYDHMDPERRPPWERGPRAGRVGRSRRQRETWTGNQRPGRKASPTKNRRRK